jgi:hypothetical protein
LRLCNATPEDQNENHWHAQRERTMSSEKTTACFSRHLFMVTEVNERRMYGELHFVHVRSRP